MSLFNFFRDKSNSLGAPIIEPNGSALAPKMTNGHSDDNAQNRGSVQHVQSMSKSDIPEHVFVEYEKPKSKGTADTNEVRSEVNDLQTLYRYLEQNLEKNGYEDALINPDTSYMEEQLRYISNEIGLTIAKIKTYYAGYVRNIDFHIETRKRSGMIETVEELISYKETVLEDIRKVTEIEDGAVKGSGLSQNLILSYRKGFRNGFAAITYNTVLSKKA